MKSFAVFQVLGYMVALLGSTGVQAVANPGLNFAAVTSTLTAFGTRFSNLPTLSSGSTTTVIISVVSVDDFQNQMSTTSVIKLTRTRTSTSFITLSRSMSDAKVNIPTPLEGIVSTIAWDSNKTTIPSSIPSLAPSPTSTAPTKQMGPSPHPGIFVSLLSSHSTAAVLPVNSLSEIPPSTSSNTAAKISQLPNPVQIVALTSPNSDVDDGLTIPPRSTVFTTIYATLTVTDIFTLTSSLQLSNLPSSDRDNPTAPAVLNLLATGPSLKENTTLERTLSTAKNITYFSPTTFTCLSPPVQGLLSQSHSLSTITQQSIPTTSALNKIPAPQWPSSPISIFRGIFRNLFLPSTRAATDDSSFASPTSPSPPNNTKNNSSSSVVLVRRRRILPAEDDLRTSLSSVHCSSVPNNDNNNNNDIPPTPTTLLAWATKAKIGIVNLFPTDGSQFWKEEKIMTTLYLADINSKKTAEQQQQPVRTGPSLTQSASPTTTVSIEVMPAFL